MTILLWRKNRWSATGGLIGLLVSIIPCAALPFALWADNKELLTGSWRYRDGSESPNSLPDKILEQIVRHPIKTSLLSLLAVGIIFGVLLILGPPVDVESTINSVKEQ
ncbi:MAG: hypothetical protein SOW59_07585 [Corynebacterium sp.]|nr:hypothetical protein [Corynebacterium sp.]